MIEYKQLSEDEMKQWEKLADDEFERFEDDTLDDEARSLLTDICESVATYDDAGVLIRLSIRRDKEMQKWVDHPVVSRFLVRAYEHFIAGGSAGACCNLGALYLSGRGMEKDVELARELYEMGADGGDDQASVNLGYIYYYGKSAHGVDYARAFECYSRAVFLNGNPEAYWKLGDLYAGGRGVHQSDRMAWLMYSKAYEQGRNTVFAGRAAHHVADYLLEGIEGVVEPDPERALKLYTEAEVGYYQAIEIGLDYYKGCLEQAKKGQEKARAAVIELRRPRNWKDEV